MLNTLDALTNVFFPSDRLPGKPTSILFAGSNNKAFFVLLSCTEVKKNHGRSIYQ